MANCVELKVYTPDELKAKWGAGAWKWPPSAMIALPFPGGVLFGAEGQESAQQVSFFLDPNDAVSFGQALINAGKQAGAA